MKERTTLFNICVIVFNILLGLAVELVIIVSLLFFLAENPNLGESVPMQVALPILLLVGLIAAMSISVKTVGWAIERFNLQDKIDPKVTSRYKKKL